MCVCVCVCVFACVSGADVQLAALQADVARLNDRMHKCQTELAAAHARLATSDASHHERGLALAAAARREVHAAQAQADEARAAQRRAEEGARDYMTAAQKQEAKYHEEITVLVGTQQRKQVDLRDQLNRAQSHVDDLQNQGTRAAAGFFDDCLCVWHHQRGN